MQKLRALLPGQQSSAQATARHSVAIEPEIGFYITIETQPGESESNGAISGPELNVHLIAARHLPSLFGFKIVQGYLIKVKLFPGTKRMDSSIQTNTWPKFNEKFTFPLAPNIKSALKHGSSAFATRRYSGNNGTSAFSSPEELFTGQFVVFTVYALLELPAASFNRFNKTYRSLKDKSSNFMQRIVENTTGTATADQAKADPQKQRKNSENPRDAMPPLTVSEARRNIGSVTCYLEPKLFKRNSRNGSYTTEELWLPIKDITTTVTKATPTTINMNNLTNAPKGVVELALEVRDLSETPLKEVSGGGGGGVSSTTQTTSGRSTNWHRMSAEVKRKMGISNVSSGGNHQLVLCVTTARMRCSHKVKDELEATAAGSAYVKTTVFEHGIYIDAWKSPNFYPSLSTKWDATGCDEATLHIPLQSVEQLENIVVRITLATKLKMGKKLVLGTVLVGNTAQATSTGLEQLRMLQEAPLNERIATWHCYQ